MKLESEEPPHGTFDTLGYSFEYPVIMNPFVIAYLQRCRIDIEDACAFPKKHLLDENSQMKQY